MTPLELLAIEQEYWDKANRKLFGVGSLDESTPYPVLNKKLDEFCQEYWNSDSPCKLARHIIDGTLDHDTDKRIDKSFRLYLNPYNFCVDVFAKYKVKNKEKEYKIGAFPTPSVDLCWIINYTHYVPRITAVRDYFSLIAKVSFEEVNGEGWVYNFISDEFTCIAKEPFDTDVNTIFNEHLSIRSKALLQSVLTEPLTVDNFKAAMREMPVFESNSIFNYKFSRLGYFEDILFNGKRYAQPTKGILLGINQIFASTKKKYSTHNEEGSLVRSESLIYALENFRTVINVYDSGKKKDKKDEKKKIFKPAFTYTDTTGFFDSFKTVTSREAGRQRLLLDNIVINDGMLWVRDGDVEKNMYDCMLTPQSERLSCLSYAPFCNNDKPKRIMMNAKLTSQSVKLEDELDPLTHIINARVGFTDIEGYTFADSIVISESFAKKLRTYSTDVKYFSKEEKEFNIFVKHYSERLPLDRTLLEKLYPTTNTAILESYENVFIERIESLTEDLCRIFLSWEVPFRLGDKITNRHGAKGTVGLILPDSKMPKLMKRVGNMEPGPLEVIISGFSTIRRGSLGQIFEAWANASGITYKPGEDFIAKMIERYSKQMEEYSKNSVVKFNGEHAVVPVGIITVMRLYHHATTHLSLSGVKDDFKRLLRFGEMEKLNLVANDNVQILKELAIRSSHKYIGSSRMISEMEETRELPEKKYLSLKFASLLKSIGYDIRVNGNSLTKSDLSKIEFDETDIAKLNSTEVEV